MNKRIEQLKALSLKEWGLLLAAMVMLPLVALSLRMRGFKQTRNSLKRFTPKEKKLAVPTAAEMGTARVIAHMVTIAAGYGAYRANCLKQSLVLWWLLARRGIESEIIFGIQNEAVETFNAHAWVECNGINLSDAEESQQRLAAFQKSSD